MSLVLSREMSRLKIKVMPLGIPVTSWECHYCLAYYHKLSMTSLKCRYLHTHIIEKGENIKMFTRDSIDSSKEEEQMVTRVGGRGRSLLQALIRARRERAGRAPQNLQETQDIRMRPQIQEVGPCGQEVERRLGGLQVWGRRNQTTDSAPNTNDRQQTVPEDRPRTTVRARAKAK